VGQAKLPKSGPLVKGTASVEEEHEVLQEAELGGDADSENNLGGTVVLDATIMLRLA